MGIFSRTKLFNSVLVGRVLVALLHTIQDFKQVSYAQTDSKHYPLNNRVTDFVVVMAELVYR